MFKTSKVVVVIPVYTNLTTFEKNVLNHNLGKLQNLCSCIICPKSLIINDSIIDELDFVERFDDNYFDGLEGYNKLLRSSEFYKRFLSYNYILILQLDVIIFSSDIEKFIEKGYDYWGAPWIDYELINYKFLKPVLPFFHKYRFLKFLRKFTKQQYLVGNGGLSLRKVKKHFDITSKYQIQIRNFESNYDIWINGGAKSMMEDVFWCLFVPCFEKKYKIAPWQEAISFSMEMNPRKAYELNGDKLPFGCHAFDKVDPLFIQEHIDFKKTFS